MRQYIQSVSTNHTFENSKNENLAKWLVCAKEMVNWYDPTINAENELLKDVDKQSLTIRQKSFVLNL